MQSHLKCQEELGSDLVSPGKLCVRNNGRFLTQQLELQKIQDVMGATMITPTSFFSNAGHI